MRLFSSLPSGLCMRVFGGANSCIWKLCTSRRGRFCMNLLVATFLEARFDGFLFACFLLLHDAEIPGVVLFLLFCFFWGWVMASTIAACMNASCGAMTAAVAEWKKGWRLRSGGFAGLCDKCGWEACFLYVYLSIQFFVKICNWCFAYSYVKMHVGDYIRISSCLGPVCMDDMYGGVGPQL